MQEGTGRCDSGPLPAAFSKSSQSTASSILPWEHTFPRFTCGSFGSSCCPRATIGAVVGGAVGACLQHCTIHGLCV